MMDKIFPSVLIALQAAAAVPCFIKGDAGHGVYWIAAAILNFSVTFIM